MSRMNRRRFTWVATSGFASAALVACGGDAVDEDLTPTRISGVEGAPPTLAPNATPFSSEPSEQGGGEAATGGGGEAAAGGGGEPITVTALDALKFDPSSFTIAPGGKIHVVNGGQLQHDFVSDELGIGTELLNGGEEATITVPADAKPGDYPYYCTVPGHREAGMEGTLTVAEGAASGGGEEAAGEETQAAAGGGAAITVTALDALKFDPSSFTVAPGQEIHVVNGGQLQHDFVSDELGIGTDLLNGGEEATITVPDDAKPGDYPYYCTVPGHREAGMEGTLTVAEAAAGGGGEEAAAEEATTEEAAAAGGGEPITVTALDALKFDPSSFTAAPGQQIHVVNGGQLQHDFVSDELGIGTDLLNGGDEATITVPEDAKPGDYPYYCTVPGHREAGMEGTLTIAEGGGGGAASSEETEEATSEEAAAAGGGGGEPITVTALDQLKFDPSEFTVAPGQDIHVVNGGSLQHDFVSDELGIGTELLNGGDEATITVPEDAKPGEYPYYCTVPGHREAGMEGTLTVAEGGGGAAASSDESADETAASSEAAGPVDASQPITVETLDSLQFDPSEIAVAPGQTIKVVNNGSLQHDFVVDEWGLATSLLGNGQSDEIVVPEDAEIGATYTYYCSVPGHAAAGMQGTLTVAGASGAAAGAAEATAEATPAPTKAATKPAPGITLDPDAIRVAALDSMRFAPSEFSAAPGQQIYLVNTGVLVHDIVVDAWDLDSGALEGDEQTTFRIPDDAEVGAEVEFYCSVPGHKESGMVGMITIIEADVHQEAELVTPSVGASPASEATPAPEGATPKAGASPVAASGEAITVTALDALKFDPSEITAAPGQEIHVVNGGMMQHDFIVDELDMATDLLNSGEEATVTVPEDAEPGEYTYYCSVPGHREAGMEGTLTVR